MKRQRRFLVLLSLLLGLALVLQYRSASAQADLGSYTVQPGDTLAEIADRFGIALDSLVQLNNIVDQNLIQVGQVLLIPGADTTLARVSTQRVLAKPGDTLADVAQRFGQDPQILTALNALRLTDRLFPGQPIAIPIQPAIKGSLRFGAIEQIRLPEQLIQGRTGLLTITTRRPVSITASWNGLPLPLLTDATAPTEQIALLPVPALLAPAQYTLTIAYTASNEVVLYQDRRIQVLDGPYQSQEIVLPAEKGGLLAPDIVQAELERISAVWSAVTPQWLWHEPFTQPIGAAYATTSPFGTRRSYNGGPYSSYHSGQDFGAPEGVPILAPGAGRVALAEPLDVRGNAILLDHGGGIYTGYWHLSELTVAEGDIVNQGDVLGLVGTTGLSTGAHLHWELRIYGIAVDPMQFLGQPIVP